MHSTLELSSVIIHRDVGGIDLYVGTQVRCVRYSDDVCVAREERLEQ